MGEDFSIDVSHGPETRVRCSGALDLLPSEKLREVVADVVARDVDRIVLDCSQVSLLTSAGITALVDLAIGCRDADIVLHMKLSPHVRRVLDMVGLWWLGVVDDGIVIHASLQSALRSYADQSFEGKITEGSD